MFSCLLQGFWLCFFSLNFAVFTDASAFGDTDLELPTVRANRSVIEIHMDVGSKNGLELKIELPLHARYAVILTLFLYFDLLYIFLFNHIYFCSLWENMVTRELSLDPLTCFYAALWKGILITKAVFFHQPMMVLALIPLLLYGKYLLELSNTLNLCLYLLLLQQL